MYAHWPGASRVFRPTMTTPARAQASSATASGRLLRAATATLSPGVQPMLAQGGGGAGDQVGELGVGDAAAVGPGSTKASVPGHRCTARSSTSSTVGGRRGYERAGAPSHGSVTTGPSGARSASVRGCSTVVTLPDRGRGGDPGAARTGDGAVLRGAPRGACPAAEFS